MNVNVVQGRKAEEKRQKAEKQRREKRKLGQQDEEATQKILSMIDQYSKSQPGQLGHDELKQLLTDKAGGKDVSDADVDYYVKRFGKADGGESKDAITSKELKSLLKAFDQYANV